MKEQRKRIKRLSERVMVATLASSMILLPNIGVNAATYDVAAESQAVDSGKAKASQAGQVSILESAGWLESANVEWKAVSGATGYNVYYKGANDSKYTQLDNQLIRQYKSYFRADVLGLAEGDYVLKIVPIINGEEANSSQAVTKTIKVKAHTREGFAFSSESPMGTGSGGYKDDGTIAQDAQIVYISADTINTVKSDVISNAKGAKTTCTGLTDILAKRQKGYDKRPMIIRMIGKIDAADINGLNSSGYIQLKGCYNLTLEGVGEDATAYKWGLLVRDAHNVEIRNIGVMLFPDDGISLDTSNENVWVHNNDIFYGSAGSDADQAKGDGSCDVKGKSDYVTVAYNHFYDSGKCSLCGMSDTENFHVSYHHNWFDHSDSRHPRIRVGTVHIYNNYFDGNAKYGVGVTKGGSAFVENNYFRNCNHPMLISGQGTDVANGSVGTFSKEPGGIIKAYNNEIEGASRLVYANEDATQFDAYLASSRDEKVPDTYKSVSGGNTYNNFDTASSMYDYNADAPEDVKDIVTTYAGRVNGGDFGWNFTTADDTSYKMDAKLMEKIKSYESDLVSIGGNSVAGSTDNDEVADKDETTDSDKNTSDSDKNETVDSDDNKDDSNNGVSDEEVKDDNNNSSDDSNEDAVSDSVSHNFTKDESKDTFFNIEGSVSSSKTAVKYNGLSLTKYLKVETSTKVSFETKGTSTLTLVCSSDFNKNIVIDGKKYKAENGIVTAKLKAGNHTISKGDTCKLYYIGLN